MKFIDTFDIILVGWLCFYFFKDVILFPWWVFFIIFIIQIIFQSIGDGLADKIKRSK
jgi:hypothetical protein